MKDKNKWKVGEFQFGNVKMTDEEYRLSQNPKIRTTMFLDADLIRAYKREAARRGVKYQALMRDILRTGIQGETNEIEGRLKRLEKKVFKRGA